VEHGDLADMIQSYLIAEEGLTKGMIFPLESRLTIGRGEENDIRLTHSTVSRQHTVVYVEDGLPFVQDMESRNGTYLNGERIERAALSSGDIVWVGDVALRFLQENNQDGIDVGGETQELTHTDVARGSTGGEMPHRFKEAFSQIPFLSNFPEEELAEVGQAAKLRLVKQGTVIVREGDMGRSMYIVLKGKVEVLTQEDQGKDIHVAYLKENEFFGEISFLTAAPRFATVQAAEDTLLCELSYESMKEVVRQSPAVKEILNKYYRERLRELQAKKKTPK
jgi:pSer/pThr/pTyr-binding forkhead associated (FHA) protein